MRAVVLDAVRARPEVREVPAPAAPARGVVVQVMTTGVCRSDWHAWAGHEEIAFPHIPGHELAGVVVEVGTQVSRWQVGDRVTVPFVCGCGRCEWCRAGQSPRCVPTSSSRASRTQDRSPSTSRCTPRTPTWWPLPEQVDFATAASLGCRFATAYRALVGRARVTGGEWVTVVGAGGVGLSAVMIARAIGARVVAVDRNPEALAAASVLGAEHTLLADGTDVPAAVTDLTGGGTPRSTRWAASGPVRMRSSACVGVAATCRSGCCRRSAVTRGCRWRG